MPDKRFMELAAAGAILNGVIGFLYAFSFVVLSRSLPELGNILSPHFLLVGGLLTTLVLMGLYHQLQGRDRGLAQWALLVGIIGAAGAIIHGGYDLANAVHTPDATPAYQANLPNPVDPLGLLTFGVTGLSLLGWAWLLSHARGYSKWLARTAYALAILMILLYLTRLTILQATHPAVASLAIITGFVVNPLWYLWLGATWWRAK